MRYGTVDLKVRIGSLSITKRKEQLVRHFPGTDISQSSPLGRSATRIMCTLIADDDAERILIEQLLHNDDEHNLEIKNYYYKKVITGEVGRPVPIDTNMNKWNIDAEFIALDPIPYSVTTDDPLY